MSTTDRSNIPPLLQLGNRIAVLPVIHGSGQFAVTVRRWMLQTDFDCVAVPLPESFRESVESAVLDLPQPSIVIQKPTPQFEAVKDWQPETWTKDEEHGEGEDSEPVSFVPIDPCQPVIMSIRAAMGEHISRAYIDLETDSFRPFSSVMPDPFAVRHVSPEKFAAAVLPSILRPADEQARARILYMASRLVELEKTHQHVLFVCSVVMWPWIREAYQELLESTSQHKRANHSAASNLIEIPEHDDVQEPKALQVRASTLVFLLGELPFITSLYERARSELEEDEDLQIDGVKELLLAARDSYQAELGKRSRRITPLHLSKCLQYIRNLSLIHRRLTPDLVTIVTAAQQILGDQYALHVAQVSNEYSYADDSITPDAIVTLGIDQARLPDGETVSIVSRLPGPPMTWRSLQLQRRPTLPEQSRWQYNWNPHTQCSHPPEDERIENFRSRVFQRANALIGNDLARTEKFTTSVKDGIDIRDTLRHWHEDQIYVKVIPPSQGSLDACVMLFDSPADPRDYPWRTTWFAEHKDESTLAFYASDYRQEMIGPGIALSTYGGAMFLYPPIWIADIWNDPRLDFAETLEERLIAAACLYSRGRQVAILSSLPPGSGWRRLARRHKKQLIHVPLSSFSDEQVQQLRMVHVLNGHEVRSYAESYIRRV